ncbi:low-density lipoprotein receptor class A domain-containing protein 1 isoform X4 [Oryx dammah]|uniref:low-density lipoprotein receptor class A domain-containing protein 1 isoform X4 n=1 Tax=Oryx dammah TaxID=59534 RepID=UPI001A9A8CDE|nr:low-density lipoprotein receptor class A domain-containing protein 1 isoform X4 [Oryx dammah]
MLPTLDTRNLRHREVRSPAHGHTAGKWLNWGLHAVFNAELRVLPVAPAPRSSSGGAQWGELGDALVNTTLDPSGAGPTHSGAQACVTQMNRTGFLCNDRSSCIPASRVCDGIRTCARGEDEEEALCLGGSFLEVKELEPGLAGGMVLDECQEGHFWREEQSKTWCGWEGARAE